MNESSSLPYKQHKTTTAASSQSQKSNADEIKDGEVDETDEFHNGSTSGCTSFSNVINLPSFPNKQSNIKHNTIRISSGSDEENSDKTESPTQNNDDKGNNLFGKLVDFVTNKNEKHPGHSESDNDDKERISVPEEIDNNEVPPPSITKMKKKESEGVPPISPTKEAKAEERGSDLASRFFDFFNFRGGDEPKRDTINIDPPYNNDDPSDITASPDVRKPTFQPIDEETRFE